jgi:hypothetical protein
MLQSIFLPLKETTTCKKSKELDFMMCVYDHVKSVSLRETFGVEVLKEVGKIWKNFHHRSEVSNGNVFTNICDDVDNMFLYFWSEEIKKLKQKKEVSLIQQTLRSFTKTKNQFLENETE